MDELLGRKVPHSAEAEQAVIGSVLIDPQCVPDLMERLSSDDFYIRENREIFETVYSMFSYHKTIDPVTILDEMKVRGVYNDGTEKYLGDVMRITPTAANALEYASIIRDKALMRHLAETADSISEMVYDGTGKADEMLDAAERKVFALRQGRNIGGLTEISQIINTVFDDLSVRCDENKDDNRPKIPGLETGLIDLDNKILGLNKSELVIVAARPGMGKTSIALNFVLHAAVDLKKTVAIFSLEMSKEQLVQRLLSRKSMVPLHNILIGDISQPSWKEIGAASAMLHDSRILINDNPMISVAEMNAQCRRLQDLDLIVIDYLQLMQSSGSGKSYANESRTQAVSDMSRMLKIMAKELNVPVVCLSQLNRGTEGRSDKRPMLSDLRESGSIEQDADVVVALHREGYYNPNVENVNQAEAIILKNRKGATGTVYLNWLPEYTSFVSLETRHEDDE